MFKSASYIVCCIESLNEKYILQSFEHLIQISSSFGKFYFSVGKFDICPPPIKRFRYGPVLDCGSLSCVSELAQLGQEAVRRDLTAHTPWHGRACGIGASAFAACPLLTTASRSVLVRATCDKSEFRSQVLCHTVEHVVNIVAAYRGMCNLLP